MIVGGAAVATAIASGSLSLIGFGINAVVDSSASAVLVWRFRSRAKQATPSAHSAPSCSRFGSRNGVFR